MAPRGDNPRGQDGQQVNKDEREPPTTLSHGICTPRGDTRPPSPNPSPRTVDVKDMEWRRTTTGPAQEPWWSHATTGERRMNHPQRRPTRHRIGSATGHHPPPTIHQNCTREPQHTTNNRTTMTIESPTVTMNRHETFTASTVRDMTVDTPSHVHVSTVALLQQDTVDALRHGLKPAEDIHHMCASRRHHIPPISARYGRHTRKSESPT